MRRNITLIAIIVFSAFLRFYKLSDNPPALNWDEISHGYNAFSILKHRADEWGRVLPIIFRAYGDYKLPVYIYFTVPSVFLFGLNAFSVRFISALSGIGIVAATFYLTKEIFALKKSSKILPETMLKYEIVRQKKIQNFTALLASLLVAIEPWSLFFSRAAFEANLALFFFVGATVFFLRGLRKNFFLIPSSLLFGLTVWTYNSYRVFTPIFLLICIYLFRFELFGLYRKSRKIIYASILFLLLFFIPMFAQIADVTGSARYGKVSIVDEGAINKIIGLRKSYDLPGFVERAVFNRYTYFSYKFFENWASHFTGKFLFFDGGNNYQFSVQGHGLIYPLNAFFLIIGLFMLLKRPTRKKTLLLSLFFLGFIPSSITREAPHVLRSIPVITAPMIISSYGLVASISYLWKKYRVNTYFLGTSYALLLFLSLMNYLNIYFTEYRQNYSQAWQYGYREVLSIVKQKYDDYDRIIMTKKYGEPHEFILFYFRWDSRAYLNDPNLIRFEQSGWFWVDAFDKFVFVNDWEIGEFENDDFITESNEIITCQNKRCLLVTSPGNSPNHWKKIESVKFLDGETAFEMFDNN